MRVINRSPDAGTVSIEAFDDHGQSYGPVTLSLGANETAHFDSHDLENGNPVEGLTGGTGAGEGDWRLDLTTEIDIDVLAYIRANDGFLTSMRDAAPWEDGGHRLAIFNPGSNLNQESLLRLVNIGEADATAAITGTDGTGAPGTLTVDVPTGAARTYTASELESGSATGLDGSLGDGAGKWQLAVRSEQAVTALSLLSSPDGLLTNLSTIPANETDGVHAVPFLPRAADPLGRQGFVRVINHSDLAGEVSIKAFDDTGREYEPLAMPLGADSSPDGRITNLSRRPTDTVTFTADFHHGTQGFVADFADFPADDPEPYELTSGYRPLPSPLPPKSALFISGVNRSDDLFMFYKGHVGGLVPGVRYVATATAEIATEVPAGCLGVGGAPGESVWIKAGASEVEPIPVREGAYLRMYIDIGRQSNGGDQAVVLGNMANSRSCEQPRRWERKTFPAGSIPEPVAASPGGRVWVLLGVDSGFESLTEVYLTRFSVSFAPM